MKKKGTILWVSGWGMSAEVFASYQLHYDQYQHLSLDYHDVRNEEDFYQRACEIIEQTSDSRPLILVGWSLGGMVAQRLAASYPVTSLILIGSTSCFVRSKEEADKGWADPYVRQMQKALKRDREKVMTDFCQAMFSPIEQQEQSNNKEWADGNWSLDALQTGLTFLRKQDVRPFHSKISCPTFILHGTSDSICPYPATEEMASRISNTQLFPLEGAGHIPMLTRKHEIMKILGEVLANEYIEQGENS